MNVGTGQQWELFGYDMRQLGGQWVAAWRSFIWGQDSPIRERLDEVVSLEDGSDTSLYQSGSLSPGAPFTCQAILLPENLVLARTLQLPLAAENDLDSVLALEVSANSPFAADDTGYGWRVIARDDTKLHVALVISSLSSVMAYLSKQFDLHDPRAREIWADVDGEKVVIQGFGEEHRVKRYRRRLARCAAMLFAGAMAVLLMAGVAAGSLRIELAHIEKLAASTQRDAAEASRLRSRMALANEVSGSAKAVLEAYPNPHYELARLTRLLGDDAYIVQFNMNGREIRLRGRAADAASVMQNLTSEPAYSEVTAPQAIVKVGNSGLEQFSLNIVLAEGGKN